MKGIPKQQHTVPRFILANFSTKDKIFVYDKYAEKSYSTNIRKTCCENGFYDFQIKVDDFVVEGTIENKLNEIETEASVVIHKILEKDSVQHLTESEKESFNYLLAVQMLRTFNAKYNYKMMPQQLRNVIMERMPKMAAECDLEKEFPDFDEKEMNFYFDAMIADGTERLKLYFRDLEYILCKTTERNPFIIGDSPVIVYNELYHDEESFYFSKHSIAYKGSCVYFPISATRALWLVDRELIDKYFESTKEILGLEMLSLMNGRFTDEFFVRLHGVVNRSKGFNNSKTIEFDENDVKRFNCFEIIHAERRIFSKVDNFEGVEELFKKSDTFKHGGRITFY